MVKSGPPHRCSESNDISNSNKYKCNSFCSYSSSEMESDCFTDYYEFIKYVKKIATKNRRKTFYSQSEDEIDYYGDVEYSSEF